MKKLFTSILVFVFLFAGPFIMNIFADTPPDPGGGPGSGDQPVGGGAPIGGGLLIMLAMGTFYGLKRIRDTRKA
jgi:hypothetical protein